jgi:undecaprenyl diphosphate synthase
MNDVTPFDLERIPRHVAIIMDGNGRWAARRHMPRLMGHQAGAKSVRRIVEACRELGVAVLTLYAFSTENWNRPPTEVQGLMTLLKSYLKSELANMLQNNIQLRCVGDLEGMPADVRELLVSIVGETAQTVGDPPAMTLNLALNYGGRAEIVRAARLLAQQCVSGELQPEAISEELFAARLYTAGQPDPDLLIRTGGESRLSNFLLWQASYAEIFITDTMWPDFDRGSLVAAIAAFQSRERRFGRTGEQIHKG